MKALSALWEFSTHVTADLPRAQRSAAAQLIFDTPIKLVMVKLSMGAADHPQVCAVWLGKCGGFKTNGWRFP